jgi:hypothetical protein
VEGLGGSSVGERLVKVSLLSSPETPALGTTMSRRDEDQARVALKAASCASQEVVSTCMNLTLRRR